VEGGDREVSLLDRFRQKRPPAAELDLLLVRRLRSVGEDLTRPRRIVHFFDFARESDAQAAARVVEEAGYAVTVAPPGADAPHWSVRAEGNRVVDETTVVVFRAWFERVAAEHAGEYDGWESPSAR
jgi:adenine-specific DNA methylase